MAHELAEKLAGLASRVSNLAVNHGGGDARTLLALQDRLADLAQVAIVQDLSDARTEYTDALKGLNEAIDYIGEADGQLSSVSTAIAFVTKAANLADQAISAVK